MARDCCERAKERGFIVLGPRSTQSGHSRPEINAAGNCLVGTRAKSGGGSSMVRLSCPQNATERCPMIPLLLALQKIAKPGDGLHPEMLRVLENAEAEKVPATGTKEIKKQDNLENSALRRYAVANSR